MALYGPSSTSRTSLADPPGAPHPLFYTIIWASGPNKSIEERADGRDGTHQGSHPGIRVGEGEDLLVKAQTLTIQIWTHPHSTLIWGGLWGPPHHPLPLHLSY